MFDIAANDLNLGAMYGDYLYEVTGNGDVVCEVGKLRYHKPEVEPVAFANPNENNIVYSPS